MTSEHDMDFLLFTTFHYIHGSFMRLLFIQFPVGVSMLVVCSLLIFEWNITIIIVVVVVVVTTVIDWSNTWHDNVECGDE